MGYSKDYRAGSTDKDYDRYGSRRSHNSGSASEWLRPSHDDDEFSSSGSNYDSGSAHDSRYQDWSQDELRSASTSERNDHNLNRDSTYSQSRSVKSQINFPEISLRRILLAVFFVIMVIAEMTGPDKSSQQSAQRSVQILEEVTLLAEHSDQILHLLLKTRPDLKPELGSFDKTKAEAFLIQTVSNDKLSSTEFLLSLPIDINVTNARGQYLIQVAMDRKFDDMVAILLANEPDLRASNKLGVGIIHTAAANNYKNVVKAALNQGTNPSLTAGGGTPLHYAARNGHADIVQLLLESGSNPRISNSYGWYAADVCREKYPEISRLIIENGGKVRSSNNSY